MINSWISCSCWFLVKHYLRHILLVSPWIIDCLWYQGAFYRLDDIIFDLFSLMVHFPFASYNFISWLFVILFFTFTKKQVELESLSFSQVNLDFYWYILSCTMLHYSSVFFVFLFSSNNYVSCLVPYLGCKIDSFCVFSLILCFTTKNSLVCNDFNLGFIFFSLEKTFFKYLPIIFFFHRLWIYVMNIWCWAKWLMNLSGLGLLGTSSVNSIWRKNSLSIQGLELQP